MAAWRLFLQTSDLVPWNYPWVPLPGSPGSGVTLQHEKGVLPNFCQEPCHYRLLFASASCWRGAGIVLGGGGGQVRGRVLRAPDRQTPWLSVSSLSSAVCLATQTRSTWTEAPQHPAGRLWPPSLAGFVETSSVRSPPWDPSGVGSFLCCRHGPFSGRRSPPGLATCKNRHLPRTPQARLQRVHCVPLGDEAGLWEQSWAEPAGSSGDAAHGEQEAALAARPPQQSGRPLLHAASEGHSPPWSTPRAQRGSCEHVPPAEGDRESCLSSEKPVATIEPQQHLLSLTRSPMPLLSPDSWDHPRVNPLPGLPRLCAG